MSQSTTQIMEHQDIYSSLADEYDAITSGAAITNRSSINHLSFRGSDSLDLLNRLSTNDLLSLQTYRAAQTVVTSNKGRIIDILTVLRLPDSLLVMLSSESVQKVTQWVDSYTFSEDVSIENISEKTAMFSIVGPEAPQLVAQITESHISSMNQYSAIPTTVSSIPVILFRSDFIGLPAYDFIVNNSKSDSLWQILVSYDINPAGAKAIDLVRIEQCIPTFNREITEDYNPLEAGFARFISFTKGCYVGQEVVTRLNTYKKVQRSLVALSWKTKDSADTGSKLQLDDQIVGVITSAAWSPREEKYIGLGYVKKKYAVEGAILTANTNSESNTVEIAKIPFMG